jgi:hypothetical protein
MMSFQKSASFSAPSPPAQRFQHGPPFLFPRQGPAQESLEREKVRGFSDQNFFASGFNGHPVMGFQANGSSRRGGQG